MASVFTKVINGDFPARFVYRDDDVVAFLTINPVVPGHTLVVPIKEVEHWIDLDSETLNKLMAVSQKIGLALSQAFPCEKIGMTVQGLEVPHVHVHLMPINSSADVDLSRGDPSPSPELLDAVQAKIITCLQL